MLQRSHLLMREKEQLKKQLLYSYRKKNRDEGLVLEEKSQWGKKAESVGNQLKYESHGRNCQNSNYYVGNSKYEECWLMRNRSILDEFTKCPVMENQLCDNETILNRWMFRKEQVYRGIENKNSVYVQTEKWYAIGGKSTPKTKDVVGKWDGVSPTKIGIFDERGEKSLIDVSNNLSSYNFHESGERNNRILTDSIMQNNGIQEQSNHTSTEQLLKQLSHQEQKSSNIDNKQQNKKCQNISDESIKKQEKASTIKVIRLTNPKSNIKRQSIKQQNIENKSYNNEENKQQDNNQQKLNKLLAKKSVLKNMIIQKNGSKKQDKLSSNGGGSQEVSGRWMKNKKYQNQQSQNKQKRNHQSAGDEEDVTDLLPPYQSSSSGLGLQAVIEEENQSQMGDSVKQQHQGSKPDVIAKPSIIKQELTNMKNIEKQTEKNRQETAIRGETNSSEQSNEIKNNQMKEIHRNSSSKQMKQISLSDLEEGSSNNIQKKQNEENCSSELKQLSLSDIDDHLSIANISEIKKGSDHKKDDSSIKKNKSGNKYETLNQMDFSSTEHQKQKEKLQKYIVGSISHDIKNLKTKILNDSGLESLPQNKIIQKGSDRQSSKGSSGPDTKVVNMLDYIEFLNNKINLNDISKSINDLKLKIVNDSYEY